MSRSLEAIVLVGCCLQLLLLRADAAPSWVSEEILEMVKPDKARCMAKHGTTEAMIDEVNKGNIENNPAITCYMFCLFDAFGLVDEEANLEVDMLAAFLPEDLQGVAEELIGACSKEQSSDVCERVYKYGVCVLSKRPDVWFMV